MADQKQGAFEEKLARLEGIVKELEGGNIPLDRAVELFNEGKKLSGDCDELLKRAQTDIDRTMEQQPAAGAESLLDEDLLF